MTTSSTPAYLISILAAWLIAHVAKYIVARFTKSRKRRSMYAFFESGGMPSSHSATVCSLATVLGLSDGIFSQLFGVMTILALIVMYDAMKVRYSSGEQGRAIHALIKEQRSNVELPVVSRGHTLPEVIAGAILGIAIGLIVFLATK